jgi:hypothetical protein
MTKASSMFGPWGLAGLASAAATAVVGVALSLNTSTPPPRPTTTKDHAGRTIARPEVTPVAPALDLDTSNLLVPPMTTSDLYAFALHGTLPIGAKRERFITLATSGGDSLQVKVHSKAPEDITPDIAAIEPLEAHALDSLQRVIRTSVIHYANGGVALRADIPQVRLAAIRTLEQMAPHLTREQLNRTRFQLAEAERTLRQLPSMRPPFEGNGSSGSGRPVSYIMVIYPDPVGGSDWTSDMLPQDQFVVRVDEEPTFTVDQRHLGSLQARMRLPIPPTPPPTFDEEMQAPVMVGSSPSIRRQKPRRPSVETVAVGEGDGGSQVAPPALEEPPPNEDEIYYDENGNLDRQADEFVREWMSRQGSLHDLRVIIRNQDSVLRHTQMMLDSANRSVHRVDSMINRVKTRCRESSGGAEGTGRGGKKSMDLRINENGMSISNGEKSISISNGSGMLISNGKKSISISNGGSGISISNGEKSLSLPNGDE